MENKVIFNSSSQSNDSENNLSHQCKSNIDYCSIKTQESPNKETNNIGLSDEFLINMLSKNIKNLVSKTDSTSAQSSNSLNLESIAIGNSLPGLNSLQTSENAKFQEFSNSLGNISNNVDSVLKISDPIISLEKQIPNSNDSAEVYIQSSTNASIEVQLSEDKNKMAVCGSKSTEGADQNYRGETDSWLDDQSSSSSFSLDSDSDCDDSFFDKMQKRVNTTENKIVNMKTKGELELDELPPIENLHITLPENEVERCGRVHAIVTKLVIVHAFKDLPPLDLDSVLFLSPQKVLGRIFDVFGPVKEPFYSVRFNNVQDIAEASIVPDLDVFYAPRQKDMTTYVFVDELRLQKGSDASWRDNNEPPEEYLDYSDDEQEKAAKQKHKSKKRINKPFNDEHAEKSEDESPSTVRNNIHNSNMHYNRPMSPAKNSFCATRSNSTTYSSAYPSVKTVMSSTYKPVTSDPYETPSNSLPIHHAFVPGQQNVAANHQRNISGQPLFRPSQPFAAPSFQNSVLQAVPIYPSSRPLLQFQQQNVPARFPPTFLQHQQAMSSKAVGTLNRQPHVFGQVPPLAAMSPAFAPVPFPPFPPPALRQVPFSSPAISASPFPSPAMPSMGFPPPAMSPAPLLSISFPSSSPNFSYFSHNPMSASSPPPPRPAMSPNSHWLPRQPIGPQPTNMRIMPPMSPLSIEIPNNLKSPPPSLAISASNTFIGISPIQPVQHVESFSYLQRY